jgi:hypothetical protein
MLALFGSSWVRGLDAATAWLPAASTTRLGVGRHLDRPSRRAFRRGMDRAGRGTLHRLFASAGHSDDVYRQADLALTDRLADRPVLTVFGALGDYLRFRPRWRRQFPPSTRQPCPGVCTFPCATTPSGPPTPSTPGFGPASGRAEASGLAFDIPRAGRRRSRRFCGPCDAL